MIRVAVVASIPALRAGIRAMLADDGLVLTSEAESADAADVIVTANDVVELAGVVREDHTQAVVALSGEVSAVAALRTMPLKGWGVVPPDVSPDELRAAVRAAALGLAVMMPTMVSALPLTSTNAITGMEAAQLEQQLTPREVEVLERVSRGLPSKLIARELDVSESTIKFHLTSIYGKLNASSRTEAVSRAAKLGLITL